MIVGILTTMDMNRRTIKATRLLSSNGFPNWHGTCVTKNKYAAARIAQEAERPDLFDPRSRVDG